YETFNMGVGLVVVAASGRVSRVTGAAEAAGLAAFECGRVRAAVPAGDFATGSSSDAGVHLVGF
ncbi:MAG: phosphoribosylformylglycinamidine cyclo-ligase, partial [Gemmatimonadota bacterium]